MSKSVLITGTGSGFGRDTTTENNFVPPGIRADLEARISG